MQNLNTRIPHAVRRQQMITSTLKHPQTVMFVFIAFQISVAITLYIFLFLSLALCVSVCVPFVRRTEETFR